VPPLVCRAHPSRLPPASEALAGIGEFGKATAISASGLACDGIELGHHLASGNGQRINSRSVKALSKAVVGLRPSAH
jgi:hypothetical protein